MSLQPQPAGDLPITSPVAAETAVWGKTWDKKTQTFHGGQDWKECTNYIEDFSVTTNGLGTPSEALRAAQEAAAHIAHYPTADFEPSISHLAEFIWGADWEKHKGRLSMGNGASELIDLVVRVETRAGGWKPSTCVTQYKEYERSAVAAGHPTLDSNDKNAVLTCLVNPCNPTGDYMDVESMKKYIEANCSDNSTVLIDESMQLWIGEHWRQDSLSSQHDWVQEMLKKRHIKVFVIHSWTKIWSCCGVRLGSLICPSVECNANIKRHQVPWSLNSMALAFTSAVVKDTKYMKETWEVTTKWRKAIVDHIATHFPLWKCHGAEFLSWLWIDTGDERINNEVLKRCKANGVPVRSGAPGYNMPTFFRMAARRPEQTKHVYEALSGVLSA